MTQIVELCALASEPGAALGFISSKASVEDVRAQLARARADAVDRQPIDGTAPAAGVGADHGWSRVVEKVNSENGLNQRQ